MDSESGIVLPLHAALMRNLGILFTEIFWFEDLAADCAEDGRWTFLYVGAPINIVGGTGAPVNPVSSSERLRGPGLARLVREGKGPDIEPEYDNALEMWRASAERPPDAR